MGDRALLQNNDSRAGEHLEPTLRYDVSLLHRLIALVGMDDLTYTHITARSEIDPSSYFIGKLGILFEEARAADILKVSAQGEVIMGEGTYNITGHYLHASLYKARPDIRCVIHTHTQNTIAVSCLEEGLQSFCQFAHLFYDRVAYHEYNALALDESHERRVVQDLGDKQVLLMRNHGAIIVGKTLQEAFFYAYYLEKACDVQLKIMATGHVAVRPSPKICRAARDQMIAFETDLGRRDWDALVRKLGRYPL